MSWLETEDYLYLGLETDPGLPIAALTAFLKQIGTADIEGRMWLPEEQVYQFFDQDTVYEYYGDRDWTVLMRPISLTNR